MALANWESSGGIKIKRADAHINDLERKRVRAFKRKPYTLVFLKFDPESGRDVWGWSKTRPAPVPLMWSAIAADAINNTSAALDILWRMATNPRPGRADHRTGAFFRFRSSDELERSASKPEQPAVQRVSRLLLEAEVYDGGANDLRPLHDAWNADKHETPSVVAGCFREGSLWYFDGIFGLQDQVHVRPGADLTPVKDGDPFVTVPRGHKVDDKEGATFDVTFNDGPLKGKPLLPTLRHFTSVADGLAKRFLTAGLLT
jgi:hypothetical protein